MRSEQSKAAGRSDRAEMPDRPVRAAAGVLPGADLNSERGQTGCRECAGERGRPLSAPAASAYLESGRPESRGELSGPQAADRPDKADTDIADTRAAGVGEQAPDGGWSEPEPERELEPEPERDRALLFDAPWVVRLFDSPYKPPLARRRDFLKAALGVFVLRGGLAFVYGLLVQELGLALYGAPGDGARLVQTALLLPLAPFLLCPYFFVLYRRLRGVGVKRPARVVRLLLLAFVLLFLISDWLIAWFWLDLFMLAPYLLLLACKDGADRAEPERGVDRSVAEGRLECGVSAEQADRTDAGVLPGASVSPECDNPESRGDLTGLDAAAQGAQAGQARASEGGWAAELRRLLCLLFDSPRKPPLYRRRDFLLATLLLLARWLIFSLAISWLSMNKVFVSYTELYAVAAVVVLLILLVVLPYFFVLYRRLVGVGFPRPALAVWLWALVYIGFGVWAFLAAPSTDALTWVDFLALAVLVAPYLILLACKDRDLG